MSRGKYAKKTQYSVGNILYWMVGILFVLTMMTTWLVSGLFAKYVVFDKQSDSAHVASSGVEKLELLEHNAEETYENSGEYKLDLNTEVTENAYEKVLPGVDIPKDPFIRLKLKNAEVDYELYVKVIESDPFPKNVTYELTDDWECVDADNSIYKCKIDAGTYTYEFPILKNDTLYVGEHYVGKDQNGDLQKFSLTFEAWLVQVD